MNKYTKTNPVRKKARQKRILEIVRTGRVRTQAELVSRLGREGFSCTQVSISRDIRELGLVKANGRYIVHDEPGDLPGIEELSDSVSGFLVSAAAVGRNLVVVHTLPAMAHSAALLLDQLDLPGLAGTVAGDDTVFAAVTDARAGRRVVKFIDDMKKEKKP